MAFSFDGSTQYLQLPFAPLVAPPFTMAGWVNADTGTLVSGLERTILSLCGSAGSHEFTIEVGDDGAGNKVAALIVAEGASVGFATPGNLATEAKWQHVVGLFVSATNRTCILNGDFANAGTDTTNIVPTAIDRLTVGQTFNNGSPAKMQQGKIAEIAIWKTILNNREIGQLASRQSPLLIRPNSLIGYASLVNDMSSLFARPLTPIANPPKFGHLSIVNPSKIMLI